jgi:hypothetical protein
MAPITSDMVVAGDGGRRANKSAGPFPAGMVGTVPQSPEFSGGNAATHSEVVTDPGSTQDVPTFTAPTSPLDGSPASFTVLDVAADAPVGEVTSGDAKTDTGERRQQDIAGTNGV